MQDNKELLLTVTEVAFGGWGVTRAAGLVVFVRGVLPGEIIRVRLRPPLRRFARADLLEISQPAATRIPCVCPLAIAPSTGQTGTLTTPLFCPGCAYQHATYEMELRLKQQQFRTLLERQGRWGAPALLPPVAAPLSLGYRNKITLHAQHEGREVRLGYFMEDNHTVLDVPTCPLALPPICDTLRELRDKPQFMAALQNSLKITFRHTAADGVLWWRGRAGRDAVWLTESTSLGPLAVPRDSFFQVNPSVAELLLTSFRTALAEIQPDRFADLYTGVGVFALAAAQAGVPTVFGADTDAQAIYAARFNCERLGLGTVNFATESALDAVRRLGRIWPPLRTAILVDPPRDGLGRQLIQRISAWRPQWLLYVSCAADTLARDLAWLQEVGYEPLYAQLLDMFPRTAYFESLTVLQHVAPPG